MSDADFYSWLSGYIDGEGSFIARVAPRSTGGHAVTTHMAVTARADEYPLLAECQRRTGLGRLYFGKRSENVVVKASPTWRWVIFNKADCAALIVLLTQYPLRSKKHDDFDLWAKVVQEHAKWRTPGKGGAQNSVDKITTLVLQLSQGRAYDPRYEPTP